MLEPFTALSAASSIVQFVDFGSRVLIEGYGLYRSQDGATEDHINLEELLLEKEELMERLSKTTPANEFATTSDHIALQKLAVRCCSLAQELSGVLKGLKVDPSTRFRTWESLRKAERQLRKSSKIEKMRKELGRVNIEINTYLLSILKSVTCHTILPVAGHVRWELTHHV